ncbi:MAG: hypothetical protein IJY74_05250, partial [Oscillospiraceae bacterium]|nr:hypothetical protein [Oscillospiraceae bacterium]
DGTDSLIDLVYLNKYNAGAVTFNDAQMANAACVDDGAINGADADALLKFIVEAIDSLPIIP